MQAGDNKEQIKEWLLLETEIDGNPHFVGVLPVLPRQQERADYPVAMTVTVAYEATENGLPLYQDDLDALNGLDEDLRSWDPEETVFRNAMRSTGGGQRKWVLYARSAAEFEALIPGNDFMVVESSDDPEWSQVAVVLAGIRR